MQKIDKHSEIKQLAKELVFLRKIKPEKYYEYKGRLNALYEIEIEKKAATT